MMVPDHDIVPWNDNIDAHGFYDRGDSTRLWVAAVDHGPGVVSMDAWLEMGPPVSADDAEDRLSVALEHDQLGDLIEVLTSIYEGRYTTSLNEVGGCQRLRPNDVPCGRLPITAVYTEIVNGKVTRMCGRCDGIAERNMGQDQRYSREEIAPAEASRSLTVDYLNDRDGDERATWHASRVLNDAEVIDQIRDEYRLVSQIRDDATGEVIYERFPG